MVASNLPEKRLIQIAPRALWLAIFFTDMKFSAHEVVLAIHHCLERGESISKVEVEQFDFAVRNTAIDFICKKQEGCLNQKDVPPILKPTIAQVGKIAFVVLVALRVQELLGAEETSYELWEDVGAECDVALRDMQNIEFSLRRAIARERSKHLCGLII